MCTEAKLMAITIRTVCQPQTEEYEAARDMDSLLFSYFDIDRDGVISAADVRGVAALLGVVCSFSNACLSLIHA